ncbi:transcriptional regulator, partial [Actinomadura adrarensis]
LRAALTADSGNPRAAQIVADLHERSPEFVQVWERHEVANRFEDRKTLVHPEAGRIEVDCQVLFTDNRAQTLLVMTTRPGTESEEKLEMLTALEEHQLAR